MDLGLHMFMMMANNNLEMNEARRSRSNSRHSRIFKIRKRIDDFSEDEIRHDFRFNKEVLLNFYLKIKDNVESKTKRTSPVPGLSKFLATLHLFATGTFQYVVASKMGFSQPTFARSFRQVINAILNLTPQYIQFPTTRHELNGLKSKFYRHSGMPNVVGLIDCTHIPFLPQRENEANYRNRKNFHSINVQIICGPDFEILDVVARFPGSCHDSYILANSAICQAFESGTFGDSILLGDNGYRLCPWLMTPYLRPQNEMEERFNHAHRKTRSMVERVFGILKSRFRCLDITGGALLYDVEIVCKIIMCCCILHNLANSQNIEIDIVPDLDANNPDTELINDEGNAEGRQRRHYITSRFFNHD